MSVIIQDQNGNDVEVFVSVNSGMVDAIIRAETEIDWIEGAVHYGLLVEENETLVPSKGVEIDAIGPVVIKPGTYDETGKQLSAPVYDNRYHLNLRIHSVALEKQNDSKDLLKWEQMAINWTKYGVSDEKANSDEKAKSLYKVSLIDPETIRTPVRIWL